MDKENVRELLILVSRRLDLIDSGVPDTTVRKILESCWQDLDTALDSLSPKE